MIMKMTYMFFLLLTLGLGRAFAQDQNFHIYLCFGQSNMEGHARIEARDTVNIDPRFKVLAAVNCTALNRTKGNWYTAVPPLCRSNTGLNPADYFGRTLVENLPEQIKVGVINVAVGGSKIELFDRQGNPDYIAKAPDWMKGVISEYEDDPYQQLVEMAKKAQMNGVIKGILLHQGESNTGDTLWTQKVKKVYDHLLKDLHLKANSVPLLAGELVNADQGGACASMNKIIATLPKAIPSAYIIPSQGCTMHADKLHFDANGVRELGRRYAHQMLRLLGDVKSL